MKRTFIKTLIIALFLAMPSMTLAAALTPQQAISLIAVVQSSPTTPASAFVSLITAFSNITVNQATSLITVVQSAPGVPANAFVDLLTSFTVDSVATQTPVDPPPVASSTPPVTYTRPDTSGSPYTSGSLGYDLSFNTLNYPDISFGFVVVGVTAGKAYTYNERAHSEYSFAQFGSIRPTLYLNLNAPYGSSATSANMSTPHTCDVLFGAAATSASSGGTYPEPTACASYNYGYNTAKGAYAYATSVGVSSPFWWLDIEEANSWSPDVAVNDAVIQGAIDYLNSVSIRAGVYSVPYMWRDIAGNSFSPTQSLSGKSVTTPTWFPIGIATQVQALNACLTKSSLIPGNPIWVIQYVADSTAVDQNIAC
ncbi:MAG: hypothetical protein WA058_00165 [Minisyncoccia bacterium]